MDPYALLGILMGATPAEIKKAYRKQSQLYHPDRNNAPGALKRFQDIQEAYDIITTGRSHTKSFGQQPPPKPPRRKPSPPPFTPPPRPEPNKTYHGHEFGESTTSNFASKKSISGLVHCEYSDLFGGEGYVTSQDLREGVKVKVNIPYGIGPFQRTKLSGVGSDGFKYVCDVEIIPSDSTGRYRVKTIKGKLTLYCEITVTTAEALMNRTIQIPNLNGALPPLDVTVDVNKSMIKIEHAGLPEPSAPRGDLYVDVDVIYKPLEDEIHATLVALRDKVDQVIKNYRYFR